MKLHLPTRLRAAVLACFAVVTSFTTTLATGALTGGAFAVAVAAVAASQAQGAAFDSIRHGGDFYISDYQYSFILDDVGTNGTVVAAYWGNSATGNYGANGLTVTANGDGTYSVALDDGKLNNTSIDATTTLTSNRGTTFDGLTLKAGVVYTVTASGIVSGDGGAKATITGVVSGTATESGTYNSNMNGNQNPPQNKVNDAYAVSGSTALIWTGDMTAWKNTLGVVTALSADKVLYFDASESVSKTADVGGDISVAAIKMYDDYTINATTAANIAANSGVTVAGDKTMTLSAADSNTSLNTISGDVIGALVMSSGKWALSGTVATSSLAVNGGALSLANVILSGSVSNNGSLTLGRTLDISAVSLGDSAFIVGNGTVTVESGILIELGSGFTPVLNSEYKVFGDGQTLTGWTALTKDSFRKNGIMFQRSEIAVTEKGFKFTEIGDTYTDMTTSGTQNWNYTDEIWDTAQDSSDAKIAFAANDSAVFSADADLTLTTTEISAAAVTVNQGATLTLTGNGNKLNSPAISLAGNLVLKDNVLANTSRVSGAGTLFIAGEVMFDENQRFASYSGDVIVQNGGILKVGSSSGNSGGVLGQDLFANSASTRTITVQQGGAIDLNGMSDFYYAVVLGNGSTLQNSGGNVGTDKKSLPKVTLTGDAMVAAGNRMGMLGGSYSKTTLNLDGHKLTKEGAGTFHLLNTDVSAGTVQVNAGMVEILYNQHNYEGKLSNVTFSQGFGYSFTTLADTVMEGTQIKSDGTSVIKLQQGGVSFTKGGTVSSIALQNTGTGLSIENDAALSVANVELAAPIVNKGTLSITGTLTVNDLSGFTPGGTFTYVDANGNAATDGYLSGTRTYTLIENSGTLNDDAITSVSGVTGSYADGVLTVSSTDESTFYVNTTVDAVELGAEKKYCINGGTLEVGTDAGNILGTAIGTTGTMKITQTNMATGNANLTTAFEGKLELASGIAFTLGGAEAGNQGDSKVINTSSFSSVVLNNGSTLKYNGNGQTTIQNLTVNEGTATLHYLDADENNAVQLTDKTTLTGNLNLTTAYDGAIAFERLSGGGNLVATGSGEEYRFQVNSLNEFTGAISLTKGSGVYNATISTGTTAVAFKGISVSNAMTLNLNVDAATTMSEGLSFSNGSTVTANIASGASLTAGLVVNENRAENDRTYSILRYTGSGLTVRDITLNDTARLQAEFDATVSIQAGSDTRLKVVQGRTLTVTSLSSVTGSDNSFLTIGGSGKVNLNGIGSIASLGIGASDTSPVVDLNGTYSVGQLRMSEQGTSRLNIKSGASLTINGNENGHSNSRSIIIAHWAHNSTLNQEGGDLTASDAVLFTSWAGTGTYQITGGTAKLKGISFWGEAGVKGVLLLGNATGGTGRIDIGSEGISDAGGTAVDIRLGNGTLGATDHWSMRYNTDIHSSANVQLIGTAGGTVFDTMGHTITVNTTLGGAGKLVKTGAGTLKLTATNTYSGGTTLNGGTLEVAAESGLGSGALSITGGTLDVTGNVTLGGTVSTTVSGGSLKASHASGWTLTGASVGGAAVSTDSTGSVTLTNATITGNITGNGKLVLAGTATTTAAATVSGVTAGGITVTTTDANKLTLNNATIGSAITNNGALELSGTQNVTLDAANTTLYADVYGSTTFGDNGYKSSQDVYTLVSGTAATAATDTTWQLDGTTVADSESTKVSFDGKALTIIQTGDTAGKVYYINSGSVEYKTGAGCTAAEKLQLIGGKLVMSKELDSAVTTGGIVVTGSSTTLELKTELDARKLGLGTGAATVLMGTGTLNLGTDTSLTSGITLGTETDTRWTGTAKVAGATLSDANLSSLGVSGSTIELDDSDGSLKGGTYAAAVLLSNGSELTLGANNALNGGLNATNGSVKITGKNSISTLTLADAATLGIDFTGMGLTSLQNLGTDALVTIDTLNAGTAGGAVNLSTLVSEDLLLTMSNGQSITLADITTNNATLGLLLDDGNSTPADSLVIKDDNGYQYTYTLAQDDATGHTVVKVSARLYQNGWIGDETDVWTTTDSIVGPDANWEGAVGLFGGYGSGTVNLDTAGVDASGMTVMVSASEHTTDYTFEGGALVANKLVVNAGSLTINNDGVETLSTVQVSDDASLTVNSGRELIVGTDMAVLDKAVFTNKGETTVIGTLIVAKDATVTNSRNMSIGGVSAEEAAIHSTGRLTVGATGGTIGALTGNGYLDNIGELTIESDTDLQALTNAGTLTVEGVLNVSATATGGVINAGAANLGYAKLAELNATGAVTATELTVDKATMQSLTADKLASLAGDTVTVTKDATLGTFSVNGVLDVGGHLTVAETVESEGEILAASADLQADATLDTLKVTGDLKATNLVVTNLEAASLNAVSLTIRDGGAGTVQSGVTLEKFSGSGSFTVQGDLTVNSTVAQGGTVQADNITVAGSAVFADVTTGSLTADAVSLINGSITTLNTTNLTVHGTVSVTNDAGLASLGGTGTLQVDNKLSLTEQITSSANVAAGILELQAAGSTLGSVLADTLTMAEGLTLSMTDALLTVDDFSVLNTSEVAISLSESVYASLDKEASGLYSIADYLIIDGVSSADIFSLANSAGLEALRAAGRDATLTMSKGGLYLSITAAMDDNGEEIGLVWDATGGNTITSTGSEIDTEEGFYKALDYVQQVLVKDDTTFDLSADAVGDSEPGNASRPELGLTVRNLRGGGELLITGNGAEQDVASLFNTDGKVTSAAEAVGLTVDAARVNLGLPEGSTGIISDDWGAESPTLASLALLNGAQVAVNADTEVLGDTDLSDTSALQVAEGSILTTHMLSGTDETSVSGVIRVTKGGVYTGSGEGADIIASGGSDLRLRTGGRKGMSLLAENGSKVTLDSAGQDGSMKSLRLGGASMARMAGASVLNLLNTTTTDKGIVHNTLSLTDTEGNYISNAAVTLSLGLAETARTLGTADAPVVINGAADVTDSSITVNMLGNGVKNGVLDVATDAVTDLTLAQLVTGGKVEGNTVVLTGTPEIQALMDKYYTNARLDKNGAITVDRVTDYYSGNLTLSENAQAGAGMADAALLHLNPQANREDYKDLAGVLDSLDAAVVAADSSSADSLGAAVSGASVAALGAAVAGDVERQLMAIRNRTTTMGVDQSRPNLDMPYFNAWINAEGDFRRVDEDGTAAGYELNSWGGTVGFDVDMTPSFTMGLAATAMYGDFTAKSADHAEGDLDTYYVTAFARYAAHRWSHTFVATVGLADTSLKRTVTHANGSYSAEGDSDAISFGFLYEVGYVAAMNESATACLQPVFNVMLSHSSLSGYDETGSDAALSMGDVDMTTVTFGLGARAQAQVGTGLLNRASLLEGRALVKLRAGDREAEAENALGLVPGATGSVTGAEMGVVGMELGVGLTVPVGSESGSVFADASLEVGGGYTNINGTVGYRISF